jgi:glutamyl-tRNA synthetase
MGYSMTSDREMYTLDEIIKEFDYKRIGVSGAVFDIQKLEWLNQRYLINSIPENKLWDRLRQWNFSDEFMLKLMPLCHSRIKTFGDFMDLCDFFFINHLKYTEELFSIKETSKDMLCNLIQGILWKLDEKEDWTSAGLNQISREVSEFFGINHKKVMMPLLFASLMGKLQGPPLFDSFAILGKDRSRARFLNTIEFLGGISNKKMDALKKAWNSGDGKPLAVLKEV